MATEMVGRKRGGRRKRKKRKKRRDPHFQSKWYHGVWIFVCVCVCLCVYVHACVRAFIHVCMCGRRIKSCLNSLFFL